MRSKNILSIAAFIVAFAFSTALASLFIPVPQALPVHYTVSNYQPTYYFRHRNNVATADKITDFILRDESNGNKIDARVYNFDDSDSVSMADYAKAVEDYVDASSSMSANDLPHDFQSAWRAHMQAWRDYSTFLNKMKNSSARRNMSSEDFQDVDNSYNLEITGTWNEVLQTGASYGADVQ